MVISQKTRVSSSGWRLEEAVDRILRQTFHYVECVDYERAFDFCFSIYTRRLPIGENIGGVPVRADFVLYHPESDPPNLIIECVAPELLIAPTRMLASLVSNIKEYYPFQTIIVFDDNICTSHAKEWLRIQTDDLLIHVFNIQQFAEWAHRS